MQAAHLEVAAHAEPIGRFVQNVEFLRFVPLLPFLGALILILFGRRLGRGPVVVLACTSVAASFAIAVWGLLELVGGRPGTVLHDPVYTWIRSGPLTVTAALDLDPLSGVMCLVVTGVGFLIHFYSTGYMSHDADYARFFAYLNLFTSAMLVLILADNLPLMFVGWEGVGLCSYLLIGFWYTDPEKASAGKKAFIVNRIGDAAFILGMCVLFWAMAGQGAASFQFAEINARASMLAPGVVFAATMLLFVGATGKSAQIPLFVWLPDAMAGPTPVSALIHAATMVTAGVYMLARLSGLYLEAPVTMNVIALVGALTAFLAATVGVVQNDIKKVLAYSTISQLGYMFLACGVGAFGAGIFHVVTHAFFKALLFLGAGSVIHGLHGEQDIRRMGALRSKMPITWATFLVGTLAISGVPGLSGFFSKDEVLAATFGSGHHVLWAVGVFGAAITAFYMTRLLVLTFYGEYRGPAEALDKAHESPISMTSVLVVLAILAAVGGFMNVPHVFGGHAHLARFLAPSVGPHELNLSHGAELGLMAFSVSAALLGIFVAWRRYRGGIEPDVRFENGLGDLHALLTNAYYVDSAYRHGIADSVLAGSRFLWRRVDVGIIDAVANGVAGSARMLADSWRRWSTGNVQHYALTFLVGVVVVIVVVMVGGGR
ncbi:MAG: NADH-quinone oxidoreductase subunit L [Candidatus Binatia bacterium]